MDIPMLLQNAGLSSHVYLFVGVTCFLTGYIPSVSTEVVLAGVGMTISTEHVLPLALVGALTQTLAKAHLYFLSRRIARCLSFRSRRKLIALKQRFNKQEAMSSGILFISALIGLPPYYLMNLLCGLLNTGWVQFCLIGFTGMFIRFNVCLAFPLWLVH